MRCSGSNREIGGPNSSAIHILKIVKSKLSNLFDFASQAKLGEQKKEDSIKLKPKKE